MKNKNEKEKEEYKDKGVGRERQRITEWRQRIESATGILLLWSQPGLFSSPLLLNWIIITVIIIIFLFLLSPTIMRTTNDFVYTMNSFTYCAATVFVFVVMNRQSKCFKLQTPPPKTVTLSRSQPPSNKHTPQNWTIIFLLLLFLRSLRFALCLWQFRSLHCC